MRENTECLLCPVGCALSDSREGGKGSSGKGKGGGGLEGLWCQAGSLLDGETLIPREGFGDQLGSQSLGGSCAVK